MHPDLRAPLHLDQKVATSHLHARYKKQRHVAPSQRLSLKYYHFSAKAGLAFQRAAGYCALPKVKTHAHLDGDGLLDVYFSTYGNKLSQLNHFLPTEKVKEIKDFYRDHDTHHAVLHSAGAPNQLAGFRR